MSFPLKLHIAYLNALQYLFQSYVDFRGKCASNELSAWSLKSREGIEPRRSSRVIILRILNY